MLVVVDQARLQIAAAGQEAVRPSCPSPAGGQEG